ncbi:MAG: DUF2911 domain-containing protein [Planctomycetes bacterium]|nr:DUF2911 domain-containing protein [Planctomycetota bacterium]
MKQHILIGAFIALAAVAATVVSVNSHAQPLQDKKLEFPQASPAASFKQRVGTTDVEVEYSRPSVKGRKIFGGLVPFGEVWRTGANAATKVTFSTDLKFGGQAIPAGTYALVTIPGATEWTVILNKATDGWGSYAYDQKNDLVRVTAKPVALQDMVETLTIGTHELRDESALLTIDWDKTRVAVKLELDLVKTLVPEIKAAMSAEGKKPYLAAAMFYYEHDLDLKQALTWIDAALAEQPDGLWIVYRKGLILAKLGDKEGALAAARQSLAMAEKKGGSLGDEYKRLNQALIARLQ